MQQVSSLGLVELELENVPLLNIPARRPTRPEGHKGARERQEGVLCFPRVAAALHMACVL